MTQIAKRGWDAIVIGSGTGGLAAAAALARRGRRVLVLEKHFVPGGLTHTFARHGYRWDVGVHYLGELSAGAPLQRLFARLTDHPPAFAAMPAGYDQLRFPDDFAFTVRHPEQAFFDDLAARFPEDLAGLAGYRQALQQAAAAGRALFAARALPDPIGGAIRWFKQKAIQRWVGRTTAAVIADYTRNPQLAAVLAAQWGDYGSAPESGSFAMHALVVTSYWHGAYYPVGGAANIAPAFIDTLAKAGGQVRLNSGVSAIRVEKGRAVGVVLENGEHIDAPWVISAIGARETVSQLLPVEIQRQPWAGEILGLAPSIAHLCLYLGWKLGKGETPAALGAGACNDWWFDSWNAGAATWTGPLEPAAPSSLFVSFPSLKDPAHTAPRHTAEVIAWIDWKQVADWAHAPYGDRDAAYLAFKEAAQRALLGAFAERYPRIAERIEVAELSTPLSTVTFTGHLQGAFYGLEATPRRLLSPALSPRTPVRGLLLAGQDVCTPGVQGALLGGLFAAGCIDPRLLRWLM